MTAALLVVGIAVTGLAAEWLLAHKLLSPSQTIGAPEVDNLDPVDEFVYQPPPPGFGDQPEVGEVDYDAELAALIDEFGDGAA